MSATSWEAIVERRRLATRSERPWKPKVYAPSLRRDQLKALYYLKELERRPMTRLLQEALDRYLEPYGGVERRSSAAWPSYSAAACLPRRGSNGAHSGASISDGSSKRRPRRTVRTRTWSSSMR